MTGVAVARYKTITPRSAFLARQQLTYWEPALGEWAAWSGRSDVTVRFSDEATGYTDEGYASTISGLGPFDMSESTGTPGEYYADVPAYSLLTPLLARVGSVIYQVIEGGNAESGTYFIVDVVPLLVADPRYAQ